MFRGPDFQANNLDFDELFHWIQCQKLKSAARLVKLAEWKVQNPLDGAKLTLFSVQLSKNLLEAEDGADEPDMSGGKIGPGI